jgi:Flp pilus assembly protein TadB
MKRLSLSLLLILSWAFFFPAPSSAIVAPKQQDRQHLESKVTPVQSVQAKSNISFREKFSNYFQKVKQKWYAGIKKLNQWLQTIDFSDPVTWLIVGGCIIGVAIIAYSIVSLTGALSVAIPVVLLIAMILAVIWLYNRYDI